MIDYYLGLKNATASIKKEYLYLGVLLGFIVVATVISSSFSRDSLAYNRLFEIYGASGWGGLTTEIYSREAFILVVSKLFYMFGLSSVFLFLIHAAISLPIKFYLIDRHSKDKWLSIAFFLSYFFILHDSTQIRFSLAVAFAYLGLSFLADGKKLLFFSIVLFSALMFHISIIVFVVMLLFTSKKSLQWAFGMVAVSILLYSTNLNAVMASFVDSVVNYFDVSGLMLNKLQYYLLKPAPDLYTGMFSSHAFLVYFCAIVIFKYRNEFNAYERLCYNAFILSIFFYILLKDTIDLQARAHDMMGFSLVFLVPYIHRWLCGYIDKRAAYLALMLFFFAYLIKFAWLGEMIVL